MKPTHSDGTNAPWMFWRWQRITRADDKPYLTRLILLRTPWFSVYLHWFQSNDDLCMHDHPWPFASLILSGGYYEFTPAKPPAEGLSRFEVARWFGPGSVLFRKAEHVHRVELGKRADGSLKPATTLVVTGAKSRSWGFWTRFGWIPWRSYHYAEHCPEEGT